MIGHEISKLRYELERQVLFRTGRRVRNLTVEVSEDRVILRGQTTSYYIKQLAQHGIRDILPEIGLQNVIDVENGLLSPLGTV